MANPNIAALANLTVGTLAWTVTSDNVVLHSSRSTMAGSGSTLTASMLTPLQFTQTGKSAANLANTMVFGACCHQDGNGSTSWSGATQNGDAMAAIVTNLNTADAAYGKMGLFYRVNPDKHASTAQDVVFTNSGSVSYPLQGGTAYLSNVDQTTPFSEIHRGQSYYAEYNRYHRGLSSQFNVPTQVGDMVMMFCASTYNGRFQPRNRDSHTVAASYDRNATDSTLNSSYLGFFSPSSYEEPIMIEKAGSYYGHTSSSATGSAEDAHNTYAVVNIQSPRTPKTLFTVPAEMSVKINSIQIANPEVPGMHVDLSVTGLPTGTTSIEDSGGSTDILTVSGTPGTVATTTICKMAKAKITKPVNVLHQPMWLQGGDSLTAKAVCDQNLPEFESRDVDIIISFETVRD